MSGQFSAANTVGYSLLKPMAVIAVCVHNLCFIPHTRLLRIETLSIPVRVSRTCHDYKHHRHFLAAITKGSPE
jgi:hypothetical protein